MEIITLATPFVFLFMRLFVAYIFIHSGSKHMMHPVARAKSLGLPVWFTFILGALEVVGGVLLVIGWYTHLAAFVLSGVMVGAIYFRMIVWKSGFYGKGGDGWYYDVLILTNTAMLFVLGAGALSFDALL